MPYNPAVRDRSAEIGLQTAQNIGNATNNILGMLQNYDAQNRADDRVEMLVGEEVDELRTGLAMLGEMGAANITPELLEKFDSGSIGAKRAIYSQTSAQATKLAREQAQQRAVEMNTQSAMQAQAVRDQAAQAQADQQRQGNAYLAQQAMQAGQATGEEYQAILNAPTVESQAALLRGLAEQRPAGPELGGITVDMIEGIGQVVRDESSGRVLSKDNIFNPISSAGTPAAVPGAPPAANAASGSLFPGQPTFTVDPSAPQLDMTPQQFNSIGGAAPLPSDLAPTPHPSGFTPPAPAAPAAAPSASAAPVPNAVGSVRGDFTAVTADQLKANLSPELGKYADDFIAAGKAYGIDPRFLAAISKLETGNGTSSAFKNKNNAMGISNSSGPITLTSVKDSIMRQARTLSKKGGYYDGANTVAEIGAIYAPPGAGNDPNGTNGGWPAHVNKFYQEMLTNSSAPPTATPVAASPLDAPGRFFTRGPR